MNKVYILTELTDNKDMQEDNYKSIIGVYENIDTARKQRDNLIEHFVNNENFVKDIFDEKFGENRIIFYGYVENWNNYIEYDIVEKEIIRG